MSFSRSPTPSAAAERLVPDQDALKRQLEAQAQRLQRAMQTHLQRESQRLDSLRARLRHPGEQLKQQRQHLAHLRQRLTRAIDMRLTRQRERVTQLEERLASQELSRLHRAEQARIKQLRQRLGSAMQRALASEQTRLTSAARELNAVSPLAVLGRGYALAQDESGQIIRRAQDTRPGQALRLRLGEGRLSVEVKRRYKQ